MKLENKNIGFAFTGSIKIISNVIQTLKELKKRNVNIIPIISANQYEIDDNLKKIIKDIEKITGNKIVHTITEAELIGYKKDVDILVIVPCSENTIGKLANGITDDTVTMAVKSHLRSLNPVVIGISTNDGLAGSAENIGKLLNRANYFFVPFKQDNPITKPRSIVFDKTYIIKAIECALEKEQIQPILL